MTQPASAAQIRAIHAGARAAGLDEDMRRDLIERETGRRSAKELDIRQAIRVIDRLNALAVDRPATRRLAKGALKLEGPFIAKVRALWISGFHLGVVRDRTDEAMVAFIRRQTGLDHANWLRDPADARKVIEALKKWLQRVAGVDWDERATDEESAAGQIAAKRAVYLAIRRSLTAAGVDPEFREFPGRTFAPKDAAGLDRLIRDAGARLRKVKAG
jgi:phage gp16-like protein